MLFRSARRITYPNTNVALVLFSVLYFLDIGDLLGAILGMFSMKVAAYLQPFTDKLITKIQKGR